MTDTFLVPIEHVRPWWTKAAPLLEPAVELTHGRWDMPSLLAILEQEEASLWVSFNSETNALEAAIVTQVVRYPTGKLLLSVLFLGGEGLQSFLPSVVSKLSSYAIHCGATGIELQGRPGWSRSLAPFGVKPNGTQLLEVHFGRIGNQSNNRTVG